MKIYKTKMPMERYPKTTMPFLLTEYIEIDRERETALDTLLFYFFSFYLYGHMAQWKRIRLRI